MNKKTIRVFAGLILMALTVCAQITTQPAAQTPNGQTPISGRRGLVQGTVKDSTGGIIPGATVTLLNTGGTVATTTTQGDGTFAFRGIAAGTYSVSVSYAGLQQVKPMVVSVVGGQPVTANLAMTVQEQKQEVTVNETTDNRISTEASNNATALILKKEDLDALPDDPDDLQADLQALAGPSAGPGGNQIYVDGFTGGRLPPKESIREIRINSNPFSAEFEKLGYGRIQIFTKPGSDKFHGQGYYNISDSLWNSRNPFLSYNPAFRTQLFGGNVSGPIGKKASFFIDTERRNIDDNGIITASIPTNDLLSTLSYQTAVATPQRRTTVSPRVDYQINANNTLSARYEYTANDRLVAGIGAFDLNAIKFGNLSYASNGYSTSTTQQEAQIVETAVLGPKVVNETHLEYERNLTGYGSQSSAPELMVAQAFIAGGSGYSAPGFPNNTSLQNYFEFQNYTSITWGAHTTKFGVRSRTTLMNDNSAKNFNGIYQFLGGTNTPYLGATLQPGLTPTASANGPIVSNLSSIQQYLTTIRLLDAGYSTLDINHLGYGPSRYTISSGNPRFQLQQTDLGPFVQDDWRVRPNLTVSLGVRFETQTDIPDHNDFAPRIGFAWSPGGAGKSKFVVRGGWGMFYDRFAAASVEQADRYSQGGNLSTYTINNPLGYDASFTTQLQPGSGALTSASQKYQIDSALRSPYLMQTAIGIERQLFSHTTLGVNYLNARGVHELRTVDINAPVPTAGALPPGARSNIPTASIARPYASIFPGDIYDYQSTGSYRQNQLLINVNSQVGRWLTLFGRYSISRASSDTDGLGSLPSNPYDLRADWGRAGTNVDNTLFLGGSIAYKWGIRLSPFIVMRSGLPYNITTGTDLYLQGSGTPTARPGVSTTAQPGFLYEPRLGLYLNPDPAVGTPIIGRNAEIGPGNISINLRVSKTWGFGSTKFSGPSGGARAGGGGGHGGPGGGFGGGGPRGMSEGTEHRYNLTLAINARNAINHENLNTPNGSMTSQYFGESTGIAGGFGPEQTASNQRRIDIQLRFAF